MKTIKKIFLITNIIFISLCLLSKFEYDILEDYSNFIMEQNTEKSYELAKKHQLMAEIKRMNDENNRLHDSINDMLALNESNVKRFIKFYGIKHPDKVFGQSILESGSFTSRISKENNNIFGMKEPSWRATTAIGSLNGHAKYDNYIASIKDYKIYQDLYYKGGDYISFLSNSGYAEDPNYPLKVKFYARLY